MNISSIYKRDYCKKHHVGKCFCSYNVEQVDTKKDILKTHKVIRETRNDFLEQVSQ